MQRDGAGADSPPVSHQSNGDAAKPPLPSDDAAATTPSPAADEEDVPAAGTKPAPTRMTSKQKITLACTTLATLANAMAFSVIAVFYPTEVSER